MVLEIVGARYLAKDFGGSFYVWTSQIGVVLIALALGYALGGVLADRWQRAAPLAFLMAPAGRSPAALSPISSTFPRVRTSSTAGY